MTRTGLRVAGGGLLLATGAIHLDLYLTGYRTIPTIGPLFLLQVIVAFGLGGTVLAIPGRLALPGRLAAAAGAGFALATLGGYLLSVWIGLFGFREVRTTAGVVAGVIEVAAFAVLASLTLLPGQARFPVQIPATIARAAEGSTAALAIAALVLLGVTAAGASATVPATASTGTGLKTATIGGVTVLTDAKGLTVYWFAPDTSTTSKCYGSCAAYWPPVTGTAAAGGPGKSDTAAGGPGKSDTAAGGPGKSDTAAGPGVPGRVGTITRTDGSRQLTYDGHPLYTYIADTAPGLARGNNINLNGGLWHEVLAAS